MMNSILDIVLCIAMYAISNKNYNHLVFLMECLNLKILRFKLLNIVM